MAKKYGNSRVIKLEVKGIEEYLKAITDKGKSVDQAVAKAIHESAKPIYDDIKAWAQKHKRSGAGVEGVELTDPIISGNEISVRVGINGNKRRGSWHVVFVEYGTPKAAADPGIRLAFERNRAKIKKIQREVLKREGMPVE